ncbi:hypothetical protein [Calidifontibacillus erzurumensis]|uniref:Uncharacterized protein n=1 Tax=Calidifontibacillus erzurumensis TaxID=2741433 RepID=A0A8J8KFQ9_9BACI|nr:hypothetical protein [Calidifontibacillus erzurumensis]NSL53185.1 hypothetical protein [Calidifontibacillus erzurumensis]
MKDFFNRSEKRKDIIFSTLIFVLGVILGTISKILDSTPSNLLPSFLEVLDLRNFFSRIGIWLFFGVLLSVYSKSPVRSAVNVFLFFAGMVASYYAYTIMIAGFFPKSYMMIWIMLTILSPIFAFICWYAKREGIFGNIISSIIIMFISRQAFAFGYWYFDIRYVLEFIIWIAVILILYRSPKQTIWMITIGMLLYFLTAQMNLLWGML